MIDFVNTRHIRKWGGGIVDKTIVTNNTALISLAFHAPRYENIMNLSALDVSSCVLRPFRQKRQLSVMNSKHLLVQGRHMYIFHIKMVFFTSKYF